MNRRGFLGAALGLLAAPAIVRAESLMKVWVPPQPQTWTWQFDELATTLRNGRIGTIEGIEFISEPLVPEWQKMGHLVELSNAGFLLGLKAAFEADYKAMLEKITDQRLPSLRQFYPRALS